MIESILGLRNSRRVGWQSFNRPVTLMIKPCYRAKFFARLSLITKHLAHSLGRKEVRAVRPDWTRTADMINFLCGPDRRNLWKESFGPICFDNYITTAAGYINPDLKTRSNFRA